MKILHLSFHKGCMNDLQYVLNKLNIDNEHIMFKNDFGENTYYMTHDMANVLWNKYKDYFYTFDCIITSDTAPLSRIFLQNNWNKQLIIWVCNRFDYVCQDMEYYNLIRNVQNLNNVQIIGYTAFENYYCNNLKHVNIGDKVITPCGGIDKIYNNFTPKQLSDIIFIPPYHNDTIMMNLSDTLTKLGIKNYCGRYDGPMDLKNYKAVVHIPYAWSNLALFESFSLGIIYFIPSLEFLFNISQNHRFFWSPPYVKDQIIISEWYNKKHEDLFIFFNSWEHLKQLIDTTEYELHRQKLLNFYEKHEEETLNKWKQVIYSK